MQFGNPLLAAADLGPPALLAAPGVLTCVVAVVMTGLLGYGIRRHRPSLAWPWWIGFGGAAMWTLVLLGLQAGIIGEGLFVLAALVVLLLVLGHVGGLVAGARGTAHAERWLDLGIVAMAVGFVLWRVVLLGVGAEFGPDEAVVAAVACGLLGAVVAAGVRLVLDGPGAVSAWLLALSASAALGLELLRITVGASPALGTGVLVSQYTLVAAAALHPSMRLLGLGARRQSDPLWLLVAAIVVTATTGVLTESPTAGLLTWFSPVMVLILVLLVCLRFRLLAVRLQTARDALASDRDAEAAMAELGRAAAVGRPPEALLAEALPLLGAVVDVRLELSAPGAHLGAAELVLAPGLVIAVHGSTDAATRRFLDRGARILAAALARSARENATRHAALHDPLTGLANRTLLDDRLSAPAPSAPEAVIFVDLDEFKAVNDSLGHAAGDTVLVEVARRLQSRVGADDLVSRIAGDEFAIVAERDSFADLVQLAEELRDVVRDPVDVEGRAVVVRVSVGVARRQPGEGASQWLRAADTALYAAKRGGRDRVAVADDPLSQAEAGGQARLPLPLDEPTAPGTRVRTEDVTDEAARVA